jgi:GTP-binding protein
VPLFKTILESVPAPVYTEGAPLQAHVTNLDASPFLGPARPRTGAPGHAEEGLVGRLVQARRHVSRVKITELLITDGLERVPGESPVRATSARSPASPTSTSARRWPTRRIPLPLPLITVDEPAISMTLGTNSSPLAGREKGTKVTARLVKDRLDRELIGNVSIRVLPTERPDTWEVQGRGELALAILVEQMRREGYELTVGKPQVVTREIDGKLHEPVERLTIDCPEEYLGTITQLLAVRKGRMEQMVNHGTGWIRMEFLVPARA